MDSVKRFTQAHSQTPWRKQIQWIGSFLLFLVLVALVAGVHLSVTARTVAVGHQTQSLLRDVERMQRSNADLETNLAFHTSHGMMEARARDLGFRPASENEISYLAVPGYASRKDITLAPPPGIALVETDTVSPAYSESLIDWFRENALKPVLMGDPLP